MASEKASQPTHSSHVCPWWLAYTFDNPIRRLIDPPQKALAQIISAGMTVLDIGCGFGHFTIGAARLVGPTGKVVAADLQEMMLSRTMARAQRCGVADRITTWKCSSNSIGYPGPVNVAIAANMIHEVPDTKVFLAEVFQLLVPGGSLYVTEPRMHVDVEKFAAEQQLAESLGFVVRPLPGSLIVRRAVFKRPQGTAGD